MRKQEFIEKIAGYVQKYAYVYGILVHSPVIAQAILESGWGESKLSSQYHNYFGLKCGTKWTGKSVNLTTKEEYTEGTLTTIKDNFRVFDSMEDGVKGYFEFIQLARYHNLRGITDPKKYLETIRADGYATSYTYVENCMNLINQYGLNKYDEKGDSKMAKTRTALVAQAQAWIGKKEADGSHRAIIDVYNGHAPLPRSYRVTYSDAWCATFVSSCAIKTGMTDLIPKECSCYYMILGFQKLGRWQENDAYIPKPGDIIFYDWDDSGSGDNVGVADHVGIVEKVSGTTITVIEGNYSNSVKRRTLSVNGRYIRGYGIPAYDAETSARPTAEEAPTVKSVKATKSASKFDKSIAGTYKTTAALNMRNGAGTVNKVLTVLKEGTKVQNYGYYSEVGGVKWLYVQVTVGKVKYTGFCSGKYLKKV